MVTFDPPHPFMSGTKSGDSEPGSLIRIWKFPPKLGGFGQHKVGSHVEAVLGCRVFALDYQLCLEFGVCMWSEEIMLTLGVV